MHSKIAAVIVALGLAGGAVLARSAGPTDPQIAHIAYTAGSIDIEAAKQALQMSKSKDFEGHQQHAEMAASMVK